MHEHNPHLLYSFGTRKQCSSRGQVGEGGGQGVRSRQRMGGSETQRQFRAPMAEHISKTGFIWELKRLLCETLVASLFPSALGEAQCQERPALGSVSSRT
jgi:hypothetical protein